MNNLFRLTLLAFLLLTAILPAQDFQKTLQLQSPSLSGEDVARVQGMLASFGLEVGEVDGWYGPQTEAAVKKFQTYMGAQPTGIVDRELYRFITPAVDGFSLRSRLISGLSACKNFIPLTRISHRHN
jgi:peptidoglycan hydrolase-like protein with peptidoglycan-binding domain